MCQLNIKSQEAYPQDVTIRQMARAVEEARQLAKSSLRKGEPERSLMRLSHLNKSKEEERRDSDQNQFKRTIGIFPLDPLGKTRKTKERKETRYHPLPMTKKLSYEKILSNSPTEEQLAARPVHLLSNTQLEPTAQGIISLPIFVIHEFINKHNGRRRHYSLGRTTFKNSFYIYLPLQLLALITIRKVPENILNLLLSHLPKTLLYA